MRLRLPSLERTCRILNASWLRIQIKELLVILGHQRSMRTDQRDELTKLAADMAHRIAALPTTGSEDNEVLDELEQNASRVLTLIKLARNDQSGTVGENSGSWLAMQPSRH